MGTDQGGEKVPCADCGKFLRRDGLKTHKSGPQSCVIKKFACDLCPYRGISEPFLLSHQGRVHRKKVYACTEEVEDCDYVAASKDNLRGHVERTHLTLEKKFKCGQCEFRSAEEGRVRKHEGRQGPRL